MTKDKYRKALKNYTTRQGADALVAQCQKILMDFGATGMAFHFGDNGRIEGFQFKINLNSNEHVISLPCDWKRTAQLLKEQKQFKNDSHAYRVALANLKDWLDAQMAILQTGMVEFPQIFLPYMTGQDGKTLYEMVRDNNYLLPAPSDDRS